MPNRLDKVNEFLTQELSKMIELKFADTIGIVSVNCVNASSDLKSARVYISKLGENLTDQELSLIQKQSHNFHQILAKKMQTKFIPKLEFVSDKRNDEINRVEELLNQIEKEDR